MRVTNQGFLDNILLGLQRNGNRLEDYQSRISSGKRVLQPSDDPAATVKILDLRSQMVEAQQYSKNAADGMDWLAQTDDIMTQVETTLHRVREIAVAAANGTNDAGAYKADASELDSIIRGLVDLGNTAIGSSQIFSGQATNTVPLSVTEDAAGMVDLVTSNIDGVITAANSKIERGIAPGVSVSINVTVDDVFGTFDNAAPVKTDLLNQLVGLRQSITALSVDPNDATAQAGVTSALGALTTGEDTLLTVHTGVGARVTRLQAAVTRVNALSDGLTELISKQEDLDVPKAILELATVDSSYQLSLQMGARIVQPTLLDFLR